MRQVLVTAPARAEREVMDTLAGCDPLTLDRWWADAVDGRVLVASSHLENDKLEGLIEKLSSHEGVRVALQPTGALVLKPEDQTALDRSVHDVTFRSPVEIVAGGLQSVGSWTGFLGYTTVSALVTWVGLYAGTVFLLVAGMLIAPFAEPAMTAAIGTARGMPRVVGRSVLRYGAALVVTAAVSAGMTLAFGMDAPTRMIGTVTSLTYATVILPLVAGVAGALNLAQSERSSLVSGAGPGILIAAALAPPAGVIGIAAVLGATSLLASAAFVLGLQLVGIHLAASIVFRLAGIGTHERPYRGGDRKTWPVALAVSGLAIVALVALQAVAPNILGRSAVSKRAERQVVAFFEARPDLRLVEVEARFPELATENTLLVTGTVAPVSGSADADQLSRDLRATLSFDGATVIVDLRVVPTAIQRDAPPSGSAASGRAGALRPLPIR